MQTFNLNLTHADADVLVAALVSQMNNVLASVRDCSGMTEEQAKELRLIRAMISRVRDGVAA